MTTLHAHTITSFKCSLCKVAIYAKNDEDSSRKMLVVFGACGGQREENLVTVSPFGFPLNCIFLYFKKNRRKYEELIH